MKVGINIKWIKKERKVYDVSFKKVKNGNSLEQYYNGLMRQRQLSSAVQAVCLPHVVLTITAITHRSFKNISQRFTMSRAVGSCFTIIIEAMRNVGHIWQEADVLCWICLPDRLI